MQKHDQKCKQDGQKGRTKRREVYEPHYSDNESWKVSNDEINRAIDRVTIKSFNFNSVHSILVTKLKPCSSKNMQY